MFLRPFAISAKGFRPFFLLASVFAAAIVPLWVAMLAGLTSPGAYLDPSSWHAHEMVFGFAVAVIAGFLLTAVGNWTQRETAVGTPLLALAALWVLGRVAMVLAGSLPRGRARPPVAALKAQQKMTSVRVPGVEFLRAGVSSPRVDR